ncbi:Ciliary-associated calcium-binding coiled-coil protein 1 [Holothuria leucospilota]|uniref:Ciliary-associated calcium-binding coiled-coil protein 1 n=1 Tax=Holothuria leucospilota TaxID=206669 RepID=A0A9Q0YQS6_HOLLE|nr:Ciliary-associated calcium-binding coiled-coil protein 1 [Holothuria leucospilota]
MASNQGLGRKGKTKTSQNAIQVAGKGPSAFKDVDWKTLSDEDAKALEKDTSLAWKVLSNSQMQHLMNLPVKELQEEIASILDLKDHPTVLEEAAMLDFYVSGFWWGKEQNWNEQQISGLFTVHHQLLENLKAKKMTLEENLTEFRKMLEGIGTKGEQNGGLDFLDVNMATSLVEFLSSTFFQHYRLYEFLFCGERKEEVISTDGDNLTMCLCHIEEGDYIPCGYVMMLEVELVPPFDLPHPPPLDEGLPEDLYLRHVAPPPPESRASVETSDEPIDGPSEENTEGLADGADQNNEENDQMADILSGVTAEEVQSMFDSVSREMFSSLQNHVASKLRERESEIIARINKIHRISGT